MEVAYTWWTSLGEYVEMWKSMEVWIQHSDSHYRLNIGNITSYSTMRFLLEILATISVERSVVGEKKFTTPLVTANKF